MDIVIFVNPITRKIETMPVQMITAYVPYASYLHLEEAARVAAIRDNEAAVNLELSCIDTEYQSVTLEDATGYDRLSVPFPY
jgi:hypothetical protein